MTLFPYYQDLPPPPPEPRPDEPPPELLPEPPDDGLELMELVADLIVEFTKEPNDLLENPVLPEYQFGGGMVIVSNFLIHLSETPKT